MNPWQLVRRSVRCAFGHNVVAGEWAYFGPRRGDGVQFILCEQHGKEHYGLTRSGTSFVPSRAPRDVPISDDPKARQIAREDR